MLFQQPIDGLPNPSKLVWPITELETQPRTQVFEHRQLRTGAHVVVADLMTIEDLDAGRSRMYRAGQAYYEGVGPVHRVENAGPQANRVLIFHIIPAGRGFDGTRRFTGRGRLNQGEPRSGAYGQVPPGSLPSGLLVLWVGELAFVPKAKTVMHIRVGPVIFFVAKSAGP